MVCLYIQARFQQVRSEKGIASHCVLTLREEIELNDQLYERLVNSIEKAKEEMGKLTEGLGLPPGMKLPF